jgi:hypothetical protein
MKIFKKTASAITVCLMALLMGAGTASAASFPVLVVDPSEIDFGQVQIGFTSSPVILRVGNQAGATFTLAVFAVRIEGSASGEYSVINDRVSGQAMDGGMSATLDVIFKPQYNGQRPADLVISYNGGVYDEVIEYRLSLTGEGTGGRLPPVQTPATSTPITPSDTSGSGLITPSDHPANTNQTQPTVHETASTQESNGNAANGNITWMWITASALAIAVLLFLILVFAHNNSRR